MRYLDWLLTLIPADPMPNLILGLVFVAAASFTAWILLIVAGRA